MVATEATKNGIGSTRKKEKILAKIIILESKLLVAAYCTILGTSAVIIVML